MTDTGNSFGQGGFGGVWGAKNLKAISAWGTGGVEVADPKAVMEARLWAQKNYASNYDNLQIRQWMAPITSHFCGVRYNAASWDAQKGISGCEGCHLNCQTRTSTGLGNDSVCMDANTFGSWDQTKHGKRTEITGIGVDLLQRMGINTFEFNGVTLPYVKSLYDKGLMGAGKNINSRLNFDRIGEVDFIEEMIRDIAYRLDIGNDLAEGAPRAAQRWGRVEEDLYTGLLNEQYYGYPNHYDARTEVYWGYATIVAGRDVNAHDFNVCSYRVAESGSPALVPAQQIADIFAKLPPYFDADMMDFSTNNIYSIHMARTTAWLMHYSTFWKQTCGLCDNAYADWVNPYGPGNRGLTPEAEPKFYKAVTGKSLSFEESMEQGRKQFNMDKAILTLQGRHRDMEIFPEFTYIVDRTGNYWMTWKENNVWAYKNTTPRHLEKTGVEEWKTNFYQLEGWDTKTGWQTRAMLESLGLKKVADELASKGKLPV
jgi:aldehyde:ferredoxin oxidoreductase